MTDMETVQALYPNAVCARFKRHNPERGVYWGWCITESFEDGSSRTYGVGDTEDEAWQVAAAEIAA